MKRVSIVAVLLLCLSARPAHASGHMPMPDYLAPLAFVLMLIIAAAPSDLGAEIPAHDPGDRTQFVLGWSWQVPIPVMRKGELSGSHHHFIGGFDYLPENDDGHFLGRFGYRYGRSRLIAGLTTAFGHAGWSWAPEIGVKLVRVGDFKPDDPFDPSLRLLVRANVAAELNRFDGVTVLLGWSIF